MNDSTLKKLDDVKHFVNGTSTVTLKLANKDDRYRWVEKTLER